MKRLPLLLMVLALPSLASGVQLEEMAALLAFPVVTSNQSPELETAIEITNGSSETTTLRLAYVAANGWAAKEGTCTLGGEQTVALRAVATLATVAELEGDCGATPFLLDNIGTSGVLVVTLENASGGTIAPNRIYGTGRILDVTHDAGSSVDPISFVGVDDQAPGLADRIYRFDGSEFAAHPARYAAHFFADDASSLLRASLILATLDGRAGEAPRAEVEIRYYDDDGASQTVGHTFDAFEIVKLSTLSSGFERSVLGSDGGHLVVDPISVAQINTDHDDTLGDGDASRRAPVLVWVLHQMESGADLGSTLATGRARFGDRAHASRIALVPNAGDTPAFDATSLPEPAQGCLLLAGAACLGGLALGRRSPRQIPG